MWQRWLRFNAVGLAGILVQLAALYALRHGAGLPVLWATGLAVETAVLHNFYWHERWTWRTLGTPGLPARLLRFHMANGLVSLVSNLLWMRVLTGAFGMHYLLANGLAIALTALLNFALSERFVFRPAR
ncbi:MAG TPA: GtrA family protein [Bryobacteraceae bacterium]|nr:GtrA family protein [Bryobacteraceae bacterium]